MSPSPDCTKSSLCCCAPSEEAGAFSAASGKASAGSGGLAMELRRPQAWRAAPAPRSRAPPALPQPPLPLGPQLARPRHHGRRPQDRPGRRQACVAGRRSACRDRRAAATRDAARRRIGRGPSASPSADTLEAESCSSPTPAKRNDGGSSATQARPMNAAAAVPATPMISPRRNRMADLGRPRSTRLSRTSFGAGTGASTRSVPLTKPSRGGCSLT